MNVCRHSNCWSITCLFGGTPCWSGMGQGVAVLPMSQGAQRVAEIPKQADGNTQNRSRALAQALQEQGFTNIPDVNGGMSKWAKRGWPMVKPQNLVGAPKS